MERIVKKVPMDCEIIALGDTHQGTIMFYEKGLNKVLSYIAADPTRYWMHMGDWIEAITSDDIRRYDHEVVVDATPQIQARNIAKLFKEIPPEQGIVGLLGNHERALRRVANFASSICEEIGIPYGTGMARIILSRQNSRKRDERLFNIFACHGYWLFKSNAKDPEQEIANKKASMKMRLKKLMGDAHVMLCGHSHALMVASPAEELYLVDRADGVKQNYLATSYKQEYIPPDQRWYGNTGSFRKNVMDGFSDYAEGYGPVELGCIKIIVRDGKVFDMVPFKV